MRTSEIDGLQWKNIDLQRREIHIREALVNGVLVEPKLMVLTARSR
jgi:integrase